MHRLLILTLIGFGFAIQGCSDDHSTSLGMTTDVGMRTLRDVALVDALLLRDSGLVNPTDLGESDSDWAVDGGETLADMRTVDLSVSVDAETRDDAFIEPVDVSIDDEIDAMLIPDAAPVDVGTLATPMPGRYLYRRLPIGGLENATEVAFHPSGAYAIVLESLNAVLIYDWATETATRFEFGTRTRPIYFHDIAFNRTGSEAYLVAHERHNDDEKGVIYRFDHGSWSDADDGNPFTRLDETREGEQFVAINFPKGGGLPMILAKTGSFPYLAKLREFSPDSGQFEGFNQARATSAGCDDFAFADNEFGTWGAVVVCGQNGADFLYYTEIGGVGEWRDNFGNLGNTSRIAAHPSGTYALAVSWSGRRLYRFESGQLSDRSMSPNYATRGIYNVAFQGDGRRALIVGRTSVSSGSVLEYRHDLFNRADITDVSIPVFTEPPYLATSNTYLNSAAFRPGCDEGLIVGGDTERGYLIHFRIEGQQSCL